MQDQVGEIPGNLEVKQEQKGKDLLVPKLGIKRGQMGLELENPAAPAKRVSDQEFRKAKLNEAHAYQRNFS